MHKRGVSRLPDESFLFQSTETFCRGTLMWFGKFLVSRTFMDNRGLEIRSSKSVPCCGFSILCWVLLQLVSQFPKTTVVNNWGSNTERTRDRSAQYLAWKQKFFHRKKLMAVPICSLNFRLRLPTNVSRLLGSKKHDLCGQCWRKTGNVLFRQTSQSYNSVLQYCELHCWLLWIEIVFCHVTDCSPQQFH